MSCSKYLLSICIFCFTQWFTILGCKSQDLKLHTEQVTFSHDTMDVKFSVKNIKGKKLCVWAPIEVASRGAIDSKYVQIDDTLMYVTETSQLKIENENLKNYLGKKVRMTSYVSSNDSNFLRPNQSFSFRLIFCGVKSVPRIISIPFLISSKKHNDCVEYYYSSIESRQ